MGDLRDWSPERNGVALEERPSSSSSSQSSLFPSNQTAICAEYWQRAEDATQRVIAQVQPTLVSENRRKAVVDYVQRLIRSCLGCEVFPFGSVPLKTYLPDGDIDLTAFGGLNVEEALASDVCSVLEREDQNRAAEFIVKDVQLIRAEVKLVKCLVQNIVVDISFNQLGGLCTLCFLEQVDRLIGKDHLFKRSIILIKAWCYYESRILGAHHGLISTYALETLVLYIYHLFHTSLNGPLAVLYKFLDYFSKFDWDNYCISLNGPVRISSLPELVAETPDNDGGHLLLSNDFLKKCLETLSVPSRGYETNSRTFPPKHLNIVDPLRENNNLGRSVSKGNFYRIRSAFTYGARKLARILSLPEGHIDDDIRQFFSNTLDRHGSRNRPDVQDPFPMSGHDVVATTSYSGTDSQEDKTNGQEHVYGNGSTGESSSGHEHLMHGGVTSIKKSGITMSFDGLTNEPRRSSMNASVPTILSAADGAADGTTGSDYLLSGDDTEDLTTSRIQGLTISNDTAKCPPSNCEDAISPLDNTHYAPHLYFSRQYAGNGGRHSRKLLENSGYTENEDFSGLLHAPHGDKVSTMHADQDENQLVSDYEGLSPDGLKHYPSSFSSVACSSEDLYPNCSGYRVLNDTSGKTETLNDTSGKTETLNSLSDLSGDYESHLNSLHYGRGCYEYVLNTSVTALSPPLVPQFQGKKSWDVIQQSVQLNKNGLSHIDTNGFVPRRGFYAMNPPVLPGGMVFPLGEMPKPRGTGTYFPNANHYWDRSLTARGRNQAPVRSPRNNGRAVSIPESNWSERSSRELAHEQFPVYGSGKSGSSDHTTGFYGRKVASNGNGSSHPLERVVEIGSSGRLQVDVSLPERNGQQNSALACNSSGSLPVPGVQTPKPVLAMNQDRIDVQSYHLKDEDDFPPLSV